METVTFAKNGGRMVKKVGLYLFIALVPGLLLVGFLNKNRINRIISEKMKVHAGTHVNLTAEEYVRIHFSYAQNGLDYRYTLLEFGSTGCAMCKQMEPVLEEIRNSDKVKVNVVFLHIMNPDNQKLIQYYGISAVPMQILLDSKGNEFFRHYGVLSVSQIMAKLN
ncbi:MAG: thioredoxin [Bacteroidia bacterium]|nr:thioredoxin [Bacteroidia bacterium]